MFVAVDDVSNVCDVDVKVVSIEKSSSREMRCNYLYITVYL